ncbi:TetR/AcrR family transcriptional regulator C-terminal domain-containing protein [Kribbella sp. NPDC004138]
MPNESVIWERPEPPERQAPSPLSRERIVRAAITLADADGLDAVSLRKVAAALDAGPMRLYRYVDTKDELLALMADAVYAEIPAPTGSTAGDVLRSIAHGVRDAALRHEWFADLHGGRPHLGPATLAHAEACHAALHASGVDDLDARAGAMETLSVYLVGAVRKEVAERRAERASGLDKEQWQHTFGPYLQRMLATGHYPRLGESVRGARHLTASEVFELGLDYLVEGMASR